MRSFSLIFIALLSFQLSAQIDTISYSLGISMGNSLKKQGAGKVNYQDLMSGIKAVMESESMFLTKQQSDSINYAYFQKQRDYMFAEIRKKGEDFLATNAQRPEVTVTESGLQYEVLTPAEGPSPTATSTVTVHYDGKLINGDLFDSSIERGEPISFRLTGVIAGWTEGLQLMSTGAKYRFFIPENLAYGSRGAGNAVPPYSTLIFDVELLSWK